MASAVSDPENLSSPALITDNFLYKLEQCRTEVQNAIESLSKKLISMQNSLLKDLEEIKKRYLDSKNFDENLKMFERALEDQKKALHTMENISNFLSQDAKTAMKESIKKTESDYYNLKVNKEVFCDLKFVFNSGAINKCFNNNIKIINDVMPDYESRCCPILQCNTKGDNLGQLNCPNGIAIDSEDRIYIANLWSITNKISVFSNTGEFAKEYNNSTLKGPNYLCISNDYLYVTYYHSHALAKFKLDCTLIHKIGSYGDKNGEFKVPCGICSDIKGFIYICDSENSRIQVFNRDLKWNKMIKHLTIQFPKDIKLDESGIYIMCKNSLHVLSANGNQYIREVECAFKGAYHISLDNYNNILVSDYEDNSIKVISLIASNPLRCIIGLKLIHSFNSGGVGICYCRFTTGIAVTKSNKIINVCSSDNSRLQYF